MAALTFQKGDFQLTVFRVLRIDWSRQQSMLCSRSIRNRFSILQFYGRDSLGKQVNYRKLSLKRPKTMENNAATQTIVEGTARMEYDNRELVFYNKIQVLNRDLSIQVIKLYAEHLASETTARLQRKKERMAAAAATSSSATAAEIVNNGAELELEALPSGVRILDALAASGLRSIRYLKEIPAASHVTINDLSADAIALARSNCERNGVDMNRVELNHGDATMFMYNHRDKHNQFDVIDLDPYGSAAPFLDAAVQSVKSGGLLCITCTDMAVLSGNHAEVCYAKYNNSMPLKGKYVHEMTLRILLHAIDSTANKYRRYIVPWISVSVDFYIRVFVRVFESPAEVKKSSLKRANIFQCVSCPAYHLHTVGKVSAGGSYSAEILHAGHTCPECQSRMKLGGPIWSEPIHDQAIIEELLARMKEANDHPQELFPVATAKRLSGILTTMSEELKDIPLYYSLPDLASAVQSKVPTMQQFTSALANGGYKLSQFHHDSTAVKTDAPNAFIWDIMRKFVREFDVNNKALVGAQGAETITAVAADDAMEVEAAEEQADVNDQQAEETKEENGNTKKQRKDGKSGKPRRPKISAFAQAILSKPMTHNIDFTLRPRNIDRSIARFPPNPEENWGPKRRAGRAAAAASVTTADANEEEEVQAKVIDSEKEEQEHKRARHDKR